MPGMAPSTKSSYLSLHSQVTPTEWEMDPLQENQEPSTPLDERGRGQGRQLLAWLPEFIWLFVSVALLVAIVVVLYLHDNKPLPEWPRGLTLNTVVATLSTFCRLAFVVAVTEAASQMKWNWFAKGPRPLKDLEVFDSASRGLWGGIRSILTSVRSRSFASLLPPILLITGLATSTLTQSAISFSTRSVLSPDLVAMSYSRKHYPTPGTPEHDRQAAIDKTGMATQQAVFGPAGEPWPFLEPTCSSADCRWPLFRSLAVCGVMKNVTEHLEISDRDSNSTHKIYSADLWVGNSRLKNVTRVLENRPKVVAYTPRIKTITMDFPTRRESAGFMDQSNIINTTISQLHFIYNNNQTAPFSASFRAVELLWHFCVNTYNVSVTNGVPKTEIVASHTQVSNIVDYYQSSGQARIELTTPGSDETFVVDNSMEYQDLDSRLKNTFGGGWDPSEGMRSAYSISSSESRQIGRRIFPTRGNLTADETEQFMWDGIEGVGEAIAYSITNVMRQTGEVEKGQAFVPVTIVTVRWEWLALLAAQIGLSVIFCVTVVVQTSRLGVDVVKSSVMAGLFAVPARDKAAMESLAVESSGKLFSRAPVDPNVVATLVKDGPGWQLALGWAKPVEPKLAKEDPDEQT